MEKNSQSNTSSIISFTTILIKEVVANVREKGTYVHALLTYGDKIKNVKSHFEDLYEFIAQLVEEGDLIILDLLRIFYLCEATWLDRKGVLQRPYKRNLLEIALSSNNWKMANFLVRYAFENGSELKKVEFWNPKSERKATPDQWANAIQMRVKATYIPGGKRVLPRAISNANFAHLWVDQLKHFKSVIDNGYVTLLDLIKYPSAFMLMVRLGADLTVQSQDGKNLTLPYCVWSSGLDKLIRIPILKFLESVDPTLFDVPCGPNKVELVYECWKAGDVSVIKSVKALQKKVDMHVRDSQGNGIGHYIHPKMICSDNFTSEDRFEYAKVAIIGKHAPAINYLLSSEGWQPDLHFQKYPEFLDALDISIRHNKRVLWKFLETNESPFLTAYCIAKKHNKPERKALWDSLYEVWEVAARRSEEERIPRNNTISNNTDTRCFIHELPYDIIRLIMLDIPFKSMIKLFSTSTTMQRVFTRMTSPVLWKEIASKQFNGFKMKYLESQSITDWRSHVVNEMKWRNNWMYQRFTERTVITNLNGYMHPAIDDNWLVISMGEMVFGWNCHTFEAYLMTVPRVTLREPFIVQSTPTSLTVAVGGWSVDRKHLIIIADPTKNSVLKRIELGAEGLAFLLRYRSKLCYVDSDLVELDVETGTTKIFTQILGGRVPEGIMVNLNEDSLLICHYGTDPIILDPDMKLYVPEKGKESQHVLHNLFRQTQSNFIPAMNYLEFGQWNGRTSVNKIHNALIDAKNDRLLVNQKNAGVSMLLHPNLKSWYTAWIETAKKFVAMNSRYLFLYDQKSGCVSCRDFNGQS